MRAPLARWLRDEAMRAHEDLGRYRVLDVGCGQKPYEPFFAPYADAYVGVDPVENPQAELRGPGRGAAGRRRQLRASSSAARCSSTSTTLRWRCASLPRVIAPGGRLLLSTHGTQVYHPSPVDYWRWTHAGLEKILRDNGEWASVTVVPASGTTACIAMLLNMYIDLAARRAHLGALARPLVARSERGRGGDRPRAPRRCASRDPERCSRTSTSSPRSRHDASRSSPAARASSARTSCAGCSSAATTCASSTTSRPATARNLDGLDVEVVEGELRSYERVHNAVRGVEVVFHLGALGSVPRSVQDPLTSSAVNVEGTLNVLLAARDEGVRRVVFSSSSSGVRHPARAAGDRGDAARPDLAVRRREARRRALLRQLQPRLHRSRRWCCATSTSSGRGRARSRSTRRSCRCSSRRSARGEPITIEGDGEQSRDFTYVANVVDATIRAAEADGASGRIFNVSAGSPATVNQLADAIGRIVGQAGRATVRAAARRRHPRLVGRHRAPRARRSAYEPRVDLDEGLRLTVEYLLG